MTRKTRITLCVFTICMMLSMTAGYALQVVYPDANRQVTAKDVIHVGSTPVKVKDILDKVQPMSTSAPKPVPADTEKTTATLPQFQSLEELLSKIKSMGGLAQIARTTGGANRDAVESILNEAQMAPTGGTAGAPAATAPAMDAGAGEADHSTVNSQVEGVSEGDIVLTDGRYVYVGSMQTQSILIIEVDGAYMKQVASIPFTGNDKDGYSWLQEMYISGDYLITVSNRSEMMASDKFTMSRGVAIDCMWYPSRQFTEYTVYDVSDRNKPVVKRSFEVEGNSIATRMIGDYLYFVSTRYLYMPYMEDMGEADILPVYRDTTTDEKFQVVPVQDIYYFPESQDATYMFVGAFDITSDEPANMESYMGAGSQIYMSSENLYVAQQVWKEKSQTQFYRFHVDGTSLTFADEAVIEGYLLNQYSMDEYNGVFRAALTDWGKGNYVYTLDVETMQGLGRTEALAPDEQIQSVRYMGNMAYVVTFRQTDPLFTIDLSDPRNPTVLGQLKIPGFSTYLHPVGDGLLIGFGRNVLETYVDLPGGGREVVGTMDIGMKISLFDISDPRDPKEIDVMALDRNSYSYAFNNPRAIMVDQKRSIFAFGEINYSKAIDSQYRYRVIAVQNRKLVSLAALQDSFSADYNHDRRRLCYIGDTLYATGDSGITAYDYQRLEKLSSLKFS